MFPAWDIAAGAETWEAREMLTDKLSIKLEFEEIIKRFKWFAGTAGKDQSFKPVYFIHILLINNLGNEKPDILNKTNAGILCLILAGISTALPAQETKPALKKGELVTADMSENESHRYPFHTGKPCNLRKSDHI